MNSCAVALSTLCTWQLRAYTVLSLRLSICKHFVYQGGNAVIIVTASQGIFQELELYLRIALQGFALSLKQPQEPVIRLIGINLPYSLRNCGVRDALCTQLEADLDGAPAFQAGLVTRESRCVPGIVNELVRYERIKYSVRVRCSMEKPMPTLTMRRPSVA